MGINYCAAFGTLLALTCGILIAIGAVLPEFVDVFLVKDASDPDATDPVAGVGVFNSEYDPSNQDPDVLAASGAPTNKFSTPTLEFPLLFPAQENFVAEVLPVDVATAQALEADVSTQFQAVQDLEFEECSEYIPEAVSALESYFTVVQSNVFNRIYAAVNQEVVDVLAPLLGDSLVKTINVPFALANATLFKVLEGLVENENCGPVGITTESVLGDAGVRQCMAGGYTEAKATFNETTQPVVIAEVEVYETLYSSECADTETVASCFASIDAVVLDTALDGAISPLGGDVTNTLCASLATSGCDTSSFSNYLQFVTGLASQVALSGDELAAAAAKGLGLFFLAQQSIGAVFVNQTTNLANLDLNTFGDATTPLFLFPATFLDDFDQCKILGFIGLVASVGNATENQERLENSCPLSEYFSASVILYKELDSEDAVNTAGLVSTLFAQCAAVGNVAGPAGCSNAFAQRFLDGAYGGDIGNGFADPDEFVSLAVSECEDDVEDNNKIAQAQKMLIGSFVFYGLTLVLAAANLVLGGNTAGLLGASGVGAILAGGLTFGALLTVRSAPVYEGVGDAASEDEPFYQEGKVVAIATAAALMELAAGICFLVGIYFACNATPSLEEEEVEEKRMVPKKEEKEDVPEVKAAEPEAEAEEEKAAPEAGQVSEKDL